MATCQVCVMHGGEPETWDDLTVCRKMAVLDTRRESVQDLGLLGRLENCNQLLSAHPRSSQHREYVDYFRRLIDTENLGDLAIARMKALLTLAVTEGQIESNPPPRPGNVSSAIASPLLPVEPRVPDSAHRAIVSDIFHYQDLLIRD